MNLPNIVLLAVFVAVAAAYADQSRQFSWFTNSEQTSQTKHQYQIESNEGNENYDNNDNQNNTVTFTLDDVIETILASNRQGRNLDGFDAVYSDPTVQDALQKGDDTEARNLIKDKLCTLGLMPCDNADSVDHKNAFLRPGELIYAQPPNAPYRGPQNFQMRPPQKVMYGAPRPMPPAILNGNRFGPRKFNNSFEIHFNKNSMFLMYFQLEKLVMLHHQFTIHRHNISILHNHHLVSKVRFIIQNRQVQ